MMRLLAPAKINLHLRVGKPRADGFHPLVTWMCSVGLFDTLLIDRARALEEAAAPASVASHAQGSPPAAAQVFGGIRLRCDFPGLACDASNLIAKAAVAFSGALERETPAGATAGNNAGRADGAAIQGSPVRLSQPADSPPEAARPREPHAPCPAAEPLSVTLLKRIPVGAGLGGGSSDGARILQALNQLWKADWSAERLAVLSATLGSDLPFFFQLPSAVCRGRGERVETIPPPRPRAALLLLPGIVMPTGPVYRRFDDMKLGSRIVEADEPDWQAWCDLPALELLPRLVNDLEAAAFALDPKLGRLREEAERLLERPVRMSGSGSSLFTLFDTLEEAEEKRRDGNVAERLDVEAVAVELAVNPEDNVNTTAGRE